MFNNIGGKIKVCAKILCWIGIVSCCIGGLAIILSAKGRDAGANIFIGIMVMTLGSLMSWVLSFAMYGFGELIENSAIIARNTAQMPRNGGGSFSNQVYSDFVPYASQPSGYDTRPSDVPFPAQNSGSADFSSSPSVVPRKGPNDQIICPKCGCMQPEGRRKCIRCGVDFANQ